MAECSTRGDRGWRNAAFGVEGAALVARGTPGLGSCRSGAAFSPPVRGGASRLWRRVAAICGGGLEAGYQVSFAAADEVFPTHGLEGLPQQGPVLRVVVAQEGLVQAAALLAAHDVHRVQRVSAGTPHLAPSIGEAQSNTRAAVRSARSWRSPAPRYGRPVGRRDGKEIQAAHEAAPVSTPRRPHRRPVQRRLVPATRSRLMFYGP